LNIWVIPEVHSA